jgi:tetratricopeptide (TPR) repeat protein
MPSRAVRARIGPVLFVLACLASGLPSPAFAAGPVGAEAFLASAGAKAFLQKDYPAALEGFQKLLGEHPDDPLVLRYIGMTYDRLNRLDEAVAAFTRALKSAPGDLAATFFLGVAEYKRGRLAEAKVAFENVAREAQDSAYGARAREFIAALRSNAPEQAAPAAGKRWDVFLQAGSQYDDNVRAEPDELARADSGRLMEFFKVGYAPLATGRWQLRVEGQGYFTQHLRDSVDGFDFQQLEGGVELSHATSLGGVPLQPALRYGYTQAYLDGAPFSRTHAVTASLDTAVVEGTVTKIHARAGFQDFRVEGVFPSVTSRDNVIHTVGVTQYFYLFPAGTRRTLLHLAYAYARTGADGDNFDVRAHTGTVGLSVPLPWELTLEVSAGIGRDDYPNFRGDLNDRETDRYTASVALSGPIWDRLNASLSYNYMKEASNYAVLDFDRNIVTLVLAYSW